MAPLRRFDDWPEQLDAFVESRRAMPFAWKENDCCTFAFDAIEAMTGRKVWPEVTWSTAMEAMRVLQEEGGLTGLWTKAMRAPPSHNHLEAQRGDVVLAEDPQGREITMLCLGSSLCGPGEKRLEFWPLDRGRLTWRVGLSVAITNSLPNLVTANARGASEDQIDD